MILYNAMPATSPEIKQENGKANENGDVKLDPKKLKRKLKKKKQKQNSKNKKKQQQDVTAEEVLTSYYHNTEHLS